MLILSIINTTLLLGVIIVYLKEKYTIVSIEDWNKVVLFYNAHFEEYDENGNLIPEEKVGGCGFFIGPNEDLIDDEEDNNKTLRKNKR